MESTIKWQTGLPNKDCFCIVTLNTGMVTGHVRFEVNNNYDRDYFKKYVKAWISEMSIKPYKEEIMKLWICKDEGSSFCKLMIVEPYKVYDKFTKKYSWKTDDMLGTYMCLPSNEFKNVTFGNSPQEVELKLVVEE